MPDLTHLSLFSGIGGLDLAAEMAGFRTVGQCEYAEYQTKVLEKNWPDVERWKDIHELRAVEFFQRTGLRPGGLTLLSGGFPCQPHSVAGMRKASGDERDLWPEYRRIVGEIRPAWVVAENVRGLLSSESGRFFRGILRDFADMGYDAGWCCYRAADVGAVHPRERIGIIAHSRSKRIMEQQFEKFTAEWGKAQRRADNEVKAYAYSSKQFMERSGEEQIQGEQTLPQFFSDRCIEEWSRRCNIFEPKLLRNYNGFPRAVDRIKSLGNAVVPYQFYPIFRMIYISEITRENMKKGEEK